MLVQTPCACAETRPDSTSRAIILSAPDSVKALLDKHLELPDKPLTSETEQAAFLRRAEREIADLLATEAYFTPQVTLQSPRLDGSQLLKVILGPRTVVTQLDIEFKGELANDDPDHAARRTDIKSSWQLTVGAPFRSSDWENAKAALLARVSRADFAAAQLTLSSAAVDIAHASAQLAVVIDSGPGYRFGELDITGLSRYNRELVAKQMHFHKGDVYRRDQLLSFQTRLQNMSQFSSATVNLDPDTATRQSAPVKVVITEMKPRKITLGLGYSDSNGARTEFNYLNHNFMGSALNLNNNLKLEQNRQTASASVDTAPDENGYVLSWGAVGQATHIAGLLTATDKLGVARSHTRGQIETRVGLDFQQEHRKPDGGIRQINQALVLDWQWHRRAIDDPLYPRSGNSTELRIGGGSQKLCVR